MEITVDELHRILFYLMSEQDEQFLCSMKGNRLYVASDNWVESFWKANPEELNLEFDYKEKCWYLEVGP